MNNLGLTIHQVNKVTTRKSIYDTFTVHEVLIQTDQGEGITLTLYDTANKGIIFGELADTEHRSND